jgi:SAM-dependent methyltransferase
MNLLHRCLCGSRWWRNAVETLLVPWALEGVNANGALLEIGPGPGACTAALVRRAGRLTCVEIDASAAAALAPMVRPRATIVRADAAAMPFRDASFDGAVAMAMLHHVPSVDWQDRLFRDVARTLRPGGLFVGVESVDSRALRLLHAGDALVRVAPATLAARLGRAGFAFAKVDIRSHFFRFQATR